MSDATASSAKRKIWITTAILAAITTFEFIIAFTVKSEGTLGVIKVVTFLVLTLVKAYYIVANFMHLGDEIKRLIQTIILPFLFIMWLIIAMMKEGDSYGDGALKDQNQKIEHVQGAAGGHGEGTVMTHGFNGMQQPRLLQM